MKTVGEFKKAGLVFVEGDTVVNEGVTVSEVMRKSHAEAVNFKLSNITALNFDVKEFAWRENTGVKPEFSGLIDVKFSTGATLSNYDKNLLGWNKAGAALPIIEWRPSLNQPSLSAESDTKESAIHKAWAALSGKVKAISEEWKTLWHVKDGYYINGEYYHSFNDKCEEAGAKFICTKREFTDYCEKMAAEEKRMDIIGQNGNDGLHYDNTAQQVEALAVKHALIQSRNPESSVKITIKNNTPHSTGSIEPVYDGSFSVCFKSSEVDGRPIFTQAMADTNELPPVGAKAKVCIEKAGFDIDNSDLKFEGKVVIIRSAFSNEEGEKIVAIENEDGNCACFIIECIEPLDTRTDREKAIDAAMKASGKAASGLCGFEDMFGKLYDAGLLKC